MTIKEVSQITGISYSTLLHWANSKRPERKNLVRFLRDIDRSKLVQYFQEKGEVKYGKE